VVRVQFRLEASKLCPSAFCRAWRQAMSAIQRHARGALGAELLQNESHPGEFVIVTYWKSAEDWRDFWSKGPPEPQGDAALNEFLVEVDRVPPPD